jgi:4-alpha-glucanotransferase
MNIHFDCYCPTRWGQEVLICGSHPLIGNWDIKKALPLKCFDLNRWRITVNIPENNSVLFDYKYLIRDSFTQSYEWESGKNRGFSGSKNKFNSYQLIECWQVMQNRYFSYLSSAFTRILFKPDPLFTKKYTYPAKAKSVIEIKAIVPKVEKDFDVAIVGNCPQLGNWDHQKAIVLSASNSPEWKIAFDVDSLPESFEYKYVLLEKDISEFVIWENGANHRHIQKKQDDEKSFTCINDGIVELNPYPVHYAGTSIPVFSLRSDDSFGTGDFLDLKKLVDWAALNHLKMIQILPVNDTISTNTFLDSYPYKAISVFALHPLFLNIFNVGVLKDKKQKKEFEALQKELNANDFVDYNKVVDLKLQYSRLIFNQDKEEVLKSEAYQEFFEQNKHWLTPYAAFSVLRDQYKTSNFELWGKYKTYKKTDIQKLTNEDSETYHDVLFWYFVQFHLDKQLKDASNYAHTKSIILKGDIPIGISRYSVDAWANPELFHFDGQAGAPPDDFSIDGQNWGFPTYNWEVMEQDHFAWWRNRLTKMNDYFDAYRIDHILGFFRIWEIPFTGVQGILGHFRPALPLSVDELRMRGVWFDFDRLCKPYIREHFLGEIFEEFAEEVKNKYLDDKGYGFFDLKEKYSNQRKIYDTLVDASGPEALSEKMKKILFGLMQLAAQVILLPDSKEGFFHPRISMHSTYSFKELDDHQKYLLDQIYIDFFYHRHEEFWKQQAMQKMPALVNATDMLICGEDLGMIPASVPAVMNHFGILSLEIQRMPKDPKKEFAHPADAPYLSVCTPSTHDMSSIRGWWEENRETTQRFYNSQLGYWGEAPNYAEPWICKDIIKQHLHSPAMWVIVPMQDLLSMDGSLRIENPQNERINEPANPRHFWKYRMHLSLEELLGANEFSVMLQGMIQESQRL